ncbi:Der GTPase activator [Actinobacillus equuli]|nr:Der GTPase activator [Actinobacillus equuli]
MPARKADKKPEQPKLGGGKTVNLHVMNLMQKPVKKEKA